MERIRNKIFSVEEANSLIPYLEQAMGSVAAMARDIASLHAEVEVLVAIESSGATSRNLDVRVLREKEARCARRLEEFRAALHEIASRGCVLRDLDLGLVDFYTMARDRVVCLCWRLGEPRVAHWHPTDEGFSGRKPLAELP
ncbi:MAG TPA: DUF2203 domain-containing protein [Candidatus Eisenbacteria bacterium]|nr:DUF2203 domain-containing protein [Candidatus Eisenbacteria bacterium]